MNIYIRAIEGRRLWQYDWLKNRESEFGGAFRTIMEQARKDPDQFKMYVSTDYITFTVILNKIRNKIQKIELILENVYLRK